MFRLAEKFQFHPITLSIPVEDGLKWTGGGGWCYEEKLDGVRACLEGGMISGRSRARPFHVPASLNNCRLDGELVRGVFHAFDLPLLHGQDLRGEPLRFRRQALHDLLQSFEDPRISSVKSGHGGEFLEAILAAGGEGIVAKQLDSRYGDAESWVKCKRMETYDCVVTEKHPTKQSVKLGDFGWCSVLGRQFELVSVGDIIEIGCHSRTASGKFREPRFIRLRPDKSGG